MDAGNIATYIFDLHVYLSLRGFLFRDSYTRLKIVYFSRELRITGVRVHSFLDHMAGATPMVLFYMATILENGQNWNRCMKTG